MSHLPLHTRRTFLKTVTALSATTGLPAWFLEETLDAVAPAAKLGPNDKPNIALIGCGGQGRADAKNAARFANVLAVCDVDASRASAAAKQFGDAQIHKDFRKLLERDDLHAILNGTPDHWHTFVNIAALKAGKDVYSEKPLTLTIDEGKRLVNVVKETERILQTGSQQRSDARFRLACELVRNERIGKLQRVTTILPAGPRRGPFQTAPVPQGLDWEFWQGQAPARDYIPERCHLTFRYWLEYSGGTITDWGAHHNDIALWGMGLDRSGPVAVEGKSLIDMIPGGFTAPSQYRVVYTYGNGVTHTCLTTLRNRFDGSIDPDAAPTQPQHGVRFEGDNGWIFVTRGEIEASAPELLTEPLTKKTVELPVSADHMGNFFDSVRSRRAPICDAEIGHRSVSLCHLGGLAIALGRKLQWNPHKEEFVADDEANGRLAREQRKPWTYETV
jgi:predicted dehydrogenase